MERETLSRPSAEPEKCPSCESPMEPARDIAVDGGTIMRCKKCGHLSPQWHDAVHPTPAAPAETCPKCGSTDLRTTSSNELKWCAACANTITLTPAAPACVRDRYAPQPNTHYLCVYCNKTARLRDEDVVVDSYQNVCHYECFMKEVASNLASMPQPTQTVGDDLFSNLIPPIVAKDLAAHPSTHAEPMPSCTVCGKPMNFKCLECGSTPQLTEPSDERAAFEKWMLGRNYGEGMLRKNPDGSYRRAYAQELYECWQEARASLERTRQEGK